MTTKTEFFSPLQNFKAVEIPAHVIGCECYYHLYHNNLKIGRLNGDEQSIRFETTGDYITANLLRELSSLAAKVYEYRLTLQN